MKFILIKNRGLRRTLMVMALPLAAVQYMYIGLKSMVLDMPYCWNYQYPAD